jgi:putative ABC transport system permease protein
MLVSTGGLLLTSLLNLWAVDPGFDTGELSAGGVLLTPDRYPAPSDRADFRRRAVRELATVPGVSAAAFATQLPFSGQESRVVFFPEGYQHADDEAIEAHYYTAVTLGYFEALDIPLLAGRLFDEGDDAEAPRVMVVDQRLARRYWPEDRPLGRRVAFNTRPASTEEWITVVGVVGNVVQNDLDEPAPGGGAFYLPDAQSSEVMWRWIVRGRDAATTHEQARAAFRRLDPEMPVFWTTTMHDAIAERLIPRRIPMLLVAGFAALALLLATLGVYGVLAYAAARRTREFGIRLALGSSRGGIYRLMLARVALLIGIGIAAGAAGAAALGKLIADQLYEVKPADPWVLGVAAATIVAVALLACLSPTLRATRVDPMVALRQD